MPLQALDDALHVREFVLSFQIGQLAKQPFVFSF